MRPLQVQAVVMILRGCTNIHYAEPDLECWKGVRRFFNQGWLKKHLQMHRVYRIVGYPCLYTSHMFRE